jgi:hypothetical protein
VAKILIAVSVLMLTSVAQASTTQAWTQMNQRANRACVAMAGLARPVLLAKRISFSDTIGVEIRQIRGTDKRGRPTRLLCAYDRASGRAEVQEGDAWNGASARP